MTATEWFFRWFNDNPEATHKEYAEAFNKAKEMEQQQLEKVYQKGWDDATSQAIKETHKYQ